MNEEYKVVLAGFGGQGILFAGRVLAYSGMLSKRQVSWLPSYGPEMRGGTANCNVCISNSIIGSPIITEPNVLVAMNRPSFDKFIDAVIPGGIVFADSSLIEEKINRSDIKHFFIPATEIAKNNDLVGFANMIILGKIQRELGISIKETLDKLQELCVISSKRDIVEKNNKAVMLGYNFS